MKEVGKPRHDPVPIGEATTPPFAILPQPESLFSQRAERFAFLAKGHDLQPYLYFLAGVCEVQHRALDGLPEPSRPSTEAVALAREHAMPPLDRYGFTVDPAFDAALDRLLLLCDTIDMPDAAQMALSRLVGADAGTRIALARAALDDAPAVEELGEHVFIAAALQVHFARLASGLDAARLVPVGEGACPACGGCRRWWWAGRVRTELGFAPAHCAARCGITCGSSARSAVRPRASATRRSKAAPARSKRKHASPATAM